MTLLCAIFTAIYMIVFNLCSVKFDETLVNVLHMAGAAGDMWIIWLFVPEKAINFSSMFTVIGTVYCGIFATAFAHFLLAKAQAKLEVSKVTLICSLEPVFATIFATLIWHDD